MPQLKVLLPTLLLLAAPTPWLHAQARANKSVPQATVKQSGAQAKALRALDQSASNLEQLDKIHADTVELNKKLSALYSGLEKKVSGLEKLAARRGTTRAQLVTAVRQLQEINQSYSLQHLQFQQQMQSENRRYTMLSNIMKTRHDTAKNSISNMR
jgi:septal ring factor EnvC (AmiA/AmiB activator)